MPAARLQSWAATWPRVGTSLGCPEAPGPVNAAGPARAEGEGESVEMLGPGGVSDDSEVVLESTSQATTVLPTARPGRCSQQAEPTVQQEALSREDARPGRPGLGGGQAEGSS